MPQTFSPIARAPHPRDVVDAFEAKTRARDAHRTATVLTLFVFIWGLVSLLATPWEPFWIANVPQTVVCAAVVPYFLRTWNRPNRRISEGFTALLIVYALLLLPWTSMVWSRMGRPVEAFTVPELALISMALMLPPPLWLRITVMSLFAADGAFAWIYAHHIGFQALLPVTEPIAMFGFFILGVGLCVLRRNRRELARDYVRVHAELQALDRVRPMFSHTRDELRTQLAILASDMNGGARMQGASVSQAVVRAIDRLAELGSRLGEVVSEDQVSPSAHEAERRLLARGAQVGAMFLAAIVVTLAIPTLVWSHLVLHDAPSVLLTAKAATDSTLLIYLVRTRRRASARRAMWAVLAIFVTSLPLVTFNQLLLFQTHRPYAPFLGHKLLMVSLGLTVASRFRLGVILITVTAVTAMSLWFALDLGAHRDVIPLAEPWITLSCMLIGLISAQMLEHRRVASVRLLRAEAEASALYRRARLLVALRDRLNSPLQTLVLGVASPTLPAAATRSEGVGTPIEQLVALSRKLADLDWLVPLASRAASFDADHELRRH